MGGGRFIHERSDPRSNMAPRDGLNHGRGQVAARGCCVLTGSGRRRDLPGCESLCTDACVMRFVSVNVKLSGLWLSCPSRISYTLALHSTTLGVWAPLHYCRDIEEAGAPLSYLWRCCPHELDVRSRAFGLYSQERKENWSLQRLQDLYPRISIFSA